LLGPGSEHRARIDRGALAAIRFAREDHAANGETPTLRRMATVGGISTKEMFAMFPKKPAKKMAYVAGLPKPVGCV
jgi:dissimilatory sulfite reductase related protein